MRDRKEGRWRGGVREEKRRGDRGKKRGRDRNAALHY